MFRWLSGKGKNGKILKNREAVTPPSGFYNLGVTLNTGEQLSFVTLRGKYVLLVNTASDCGFTPQYAELQQLYEENKDRLTIIGFPANDFKQQEPYTDEEIAGFCRVNYGVTFPLAAKSAVLPGAGQNPVYQWLTDPALNGWNHHPPDWNFSKYLVSPQGVLLYYFGPAVAPSDVQTWLRPAGG